MDQIPTPEHLDLLRALIHGLIALFGGLANALSSNPHSLKALFANIIVSSFAGFLFGLLALHFFGDKEYITLTISGMGGYLGKEGLDFFSRKMASILLREVAREISDSDN